MVEQFMLENNQKRLKYQQEFQLMFGISLSGFWNVLTGFDVIKFDEKFLKTPDGISTVEFVKRNYGDYGVKIIEGLI